MNHSQTRFILSLIIFDNFIYQHFYFWKLLGLDLTILLNSSCLATQTFLPERIRKIYSSSCSSSLFSFFPTSQFCLIPSLLLRGSSLPFLLLHLILSQPGPLSIDLCHAAAILSREIKKFWYLHGQPRSYCGANRGKTKLFESPGIKWPPLDKGLHMTSCPPCWGSKTMLKMAAILGRQDDLLELVSYVNPFFCCN